MDRCNRFTFIIRLTQAGPSVKRMQSEASRSEINKAIHSPAPTLNSGYYLPAGCAANTPHLIPDMERQGNGLRDLGACQQSHSFVSYLAFVIVQAE